MLDEDLAKEAKTITLAKVLAVLGSYFLGLYILTFADNVPKSIQKFFPDIVLLMWMCWVIFTARYVIRKLGVLKNG